MSNRRKLKNRFTGRGKPFDKAQRVVSVNAPSEEKVLLKTVPAKAGEHIVGEAFLYDDGSVDFVIDEDAPQEALDLIKTTEMEYMAVMQGKKETDG